MAFTFEQPYSIPKEDARARLQALSDYLRSKIGLKVTWDGDRASVSGRYMVVSIDGSLILDQSVVRFEGKDPGFLWRGKAKDYLSRKLALYLDAATPLDKLQRA